MLNDWLITMILGGVFVFLEKIKRSQYSFFQGLDLSVVDRGLAGIFNGILASGLGYV